MWLHKNHSGLSDVPSWRGGFYPSHDFWSGSLYKSSRLTVIRVLSSSCRPPTANAVEAPCHKEQRSLVLLRRGKRVATSSSERCSRSAILTDTPGGTCVWEGHRYRLLQQHLDTSSVRQVTVMRTLVQPQPGGGRWQERRFAGGTCAVLWLRGGRTLMGGTSELELGARHFVARFPWKGTVGSVLGPGDWPPECGLWHSCPAHRTVLLSSFSF